MQAPPQKRDTKRLGNLRQSTWAAIFFAALFAFVLIAGFVLGREVFSDLERQRTASSDNVQWTLTQVEVEYLAYLNTLDHFAHAPAAERQTLVAEARKQFDIFFSRVDTLGASPLFADLRGSETYSRPLANVQAYLAGAIPLIDSDDLTGGTAAAELLAGADAVHDDIRALSLSGLSYFATLSDARRADTAKTLMRLTFIALMLLIMLISLAGYLYVVNRKVRQRGRALRQANARVQKVMATSLDAVIVVNSDGHVLEFNPSAEAMFGRTRSEALGKSIGTLIVPDHLRDAHTAGMTRMKSGGPRHVVGHGRVQLEAMRASGEVFPVELALESAFNGTEEIVIGFVRDISKRVAAQTELIAARDTALAGEQAKDNFLKVMSHEIRTPLNGLIGNLSLLTHTKLTEAQQQLTHNMQVSGQVLMNHVDSVLDIARFEAGKLTAAHEPVSLNELMQGIVDGQSGNAASRGNAIQWQWIGAPQPWVLTDAQRLRQILLNLVGNAIKFTENGLISLEVECSAGLDPAKPEFEFRVIDTGIGISEADQARIFEDFETSDPSTSRTVSGTGLGLGIARRFATTLGGALGVESTPGSGSVFWLRLPLETTQAAQTPPETTGAQAVDARLDVLVVEDNEINSEVVRKMLELDGHTVTLAGDGRAGVEAADRHRYDVILMDISMPVMDGLAATQHIRTGRGQSKDTPVIAVSANVLPGAIETFRAAGMNAFLGKPLTVDSLRHALSTILHGGFGAAPAGSAGPARPAPAAALEAARTAIRDLETQLGAEKIHALLGTFLTEGDALAAQIAAPDWLDRDAKAVAAGSHKLAGSAGVLGFDALGAALQHIQSAAQEGAAPQARDAAARFGPVWAEVAAAVRAHLAEP